jgi:predicted RNase H-like HicB family nuclease
VYATGRSLEECRENLKHVIEGWILARREHNLDVPSICPATDGNGLHGGGVDQK